MIFLKNYLLTFFRKIRAIAEFFFTYFTEIASRIFRRVSESSVFRGKKVWIILSEIITNTPGGTINVYHHE